MTLTMWDKHRNKVYVFCGTLAVMAAALVIWKPFHARPLTEDEYGAQLRREITELETRTDASLHKNAWVEEEMDHFIKQNLEPKGAVFKEPGAARACPTFTDSGGKIRVDTNKRTEDCRAFKQMYDNHERNLDHHKYEQWRDMGIAQKHSQQLREFQKMSQQDKTAALSKSVDDQNARSGASWKTGIAALGVPAAATGCFSCFEEDPKQEPDSAEQRRLRDLEAENARLKREAASRTPEKPKKEDKPSCIHGWGVFWLILLMLFTPVLIFYCCSTTKTDGDNESRKEGEEEETKVETETKPNRKKLKLAKETEDDTAGDTESDPQTKIVISVDSPKEQAVSLVADSPKPKLDASFEIEEVTQSTEDADAEFESNSLPEDGHTIDI